MKHVHRRVPYTNQLPRHQHQKPYDCAIDEPTQKRPKSPLGRRPDDPSPEYIEHMKRLIRAEKNELEPTPVPAKVDWTSLTHLLACEFDAE